LSAVYVTTLRRFRPVRSALWSVDPFLGEDKMTLIVFSWILFAVLVILPGIIAFRIAREKKNRG
ncbi:MAG: hypothetical protein KBE18_02965, partial [Synergistaceae bacterium]|nr:hypothetical protein [Synergistaceae bacterium]